MEAKQKKISTQVSEEELRRKTLVRKRCLGVLIVLDVLVLVYLIVQIILVFTNK